MKPADRIKKLIEKSDVTTGSEINKRILGDALEHFEKLRQQKATGAQPGTWRIIMKSPITKIAAAIVIVTGVLITMQLVGNPFAATVTFADVIQPILNAQTATLDILIGSQENQPVIHDEVMGSRIRRTVSDVNHSEIIIDLEQQKMLTFDHSAKTALFIELGGLDNLKNYLEVLQNLVIRLQDNPDFQVEDRGLQKIEGRDYLVFVAESKQETITIWADPKTALPTRIEQKTPNMKIVCDNLQFDVALDESRFSMEVPDDYTIQNAGIDFGKNSESDFIETLRIWAEIIEDGYFPDSINLENAVQIGLKFDRALRRSNLTEQQIGEVALRFGQGLVFIRFFKGQGKWHWNGVGVELGDAETPIFWYRPKDSETWRVIYGDLHVEDVAEQDLPEPVLTDKQAKIIRSYQQCEKQEFVGNEKDVWHITASGDIIAHSNITLTKIPPDISVMYIKLPYTCGVLESAKLNNEEILFSPVIKGRYELELPFENLREGQPIIECIWSMPLDTLVKADYGYRINLQGLIPVTGFRLTAVLEKDCGFEFTKYTKDPSIRSLDLFRAGEMTSATMVMGSCGLPVNRSN